MDVATKFSPRRVPRPLAAQAGLTLVEMMVSIAIALTVMSGVVQVLVVSKSNFITERELSGLQENARFALKFLGDEVRMAGFSGCKSSPINNIVGSAASWYLKDLGLQGYDYDAGVSTFPPEFRPDVAANTDALVIRRGEDVGLRASAYAAPALTLNKAHAFTPGQPMVLANPDCLQVGMFQISAPANADGTATTMEHATAVGITPYVGGSRVMPLRSEAYYVGASEADASVPALFRERMLLDTTTDTLYTAAEELVQGVENMQILYGLDKDPLAMPDGLADVYEKADVVETDDDWGKVVTVRLIMRMRSVNPVYNENVAYPEFEGVTGTNGADRYMRQTAATTIQIRNS